MNRLPFHRVRGEVPLTDADFAEIRRNVLMKVSRRQTHAGRWMALAAAAAVAVVLFVPSQDVSVPVTVSNPRPAVISVGQPPAVQAAEPAAPHVEAAVPRKKRSRRAPSAPVRMEFQTADPDVRIIWIAQ